MWSFAQKILFHDRVRFVIASAGVSVSVMLVLAQVGMFAGFMNNASALIDHSRADLWVARAGIDNIDGPDTMDDTIVPRIASIPGVVLAEPLIVAWGGFRRAGGGLQGVEVIGLEPGSQLLRPWQIIAGDLDRIFDVDGIAIDVSELERFTVSGVGARSEIGNVGTRVAALTEGVKNFTVFPFAWTNSITARTYLRMPADQIHFVLVKTSPGARAAVRHEIAKISHVDVFTKPELSALTQSFWSTRTGAGAGFATNAGLGVIVGLVIVGQILYSGTVEHLREYATLKAMGARNGQIVQLIVTQALITSGFGFVLGTLLAFGAARGMATKGIAVDISWQLLVTSGLGSAVMCVLAACLSVIRVLRLDPASVLKG